MRSCEQVAAEDVTKIFRFNLLLVNFKTFQLPFFVFNLILIPPTPFAINFESINIEERSKPISHRGQKFD